MATDEARDFIGVKINKLTFIRPVSRPYHKKTPGTYWEVLCDCGVLTEIPYHSRFKTRSCGCLFKEIATAQGVSKRTHGHSTGGKRTSEYETWQGMRQRCHNPKSRSYHNYGARGISVHPAWRGSFEAFIADVGRRPPGKTKYGKVKYTLDRINNDGNYEPGNVRWATQAQQTANRRTTLWILYKRRFYLLKNLSFHLKMPKAVIMTATKKTPGVLSTKAVRDIRDKRAAFLAAGNGTFRASARGWE